MFDIAASDQDDLHGGTTPWRRHARRVPLAHLQDSIRCDVVVVGAGITGALVAENLTRQGLDICVVDREQPGLGSTVASTAMLLWEIDKPLREFVISHGFERAANIYRQSAAAASGLLSLISELTIDCSARANPSLYLSTDESGPRILLEEHELRRRAGLPGEFLDHQAVLSRFGIAREAALLSPGSADVDPVMLSQSLLAVAASRGARLFDAQACDFDSSGKEATIELDNGKLIAAKWIVLATGYVLPDFVRSDLHSLASSWAICTPPQTRSAIWPEDALIWEASEDYHYARTTADGRIIIGGEDETDVVEPDARDALIATKTERLLSELQRLRPEAVPVAEFAWAGAFGKTIDSLPMIGRVPGRPRMLGAYGYGGNGITFSFLASRIIADTIAGTERTDCDVFSFERDRAG